jgi:tetratricopeptide (TPR) repeat protein
MYLRRLALALSELGDVTSARELRERALSISRTAFGNAHPATALQMNDLANSLYLQGDYSLALSLFEQALAAYSVPNTESAGAIAASYNLGVVTADLGDFNDAEAFYLRAIAAWTRLHGPEHPFIAYGLVALGDVRRGLGQYDAAKTLYERALAIRETKLGPNSLDVARVLTTLARTLLDLGETSLALERCTRAVDVWKISNAEDSQGYADALSLRAEIQARIGYLSAARASYQEALATLTRAYGPSHFALAEIKSSLALVLAASGDVAEATRSALDAELIDRSYVTLTVRYLAERRALSSPISSTTTSVWPCRWPCGDLATRPSCTIA